MSAGLNPGLRKLLQFAALLSGSSLETENQELPGIVLNGITYSADFFERPFLPCALVEVASKTFSSGERGGSR